MKRLKFSRDIIVKVTHLTLHHMSMVGYDSGWSDGELRRLIRGVGLANLDHLLAFREADIWAHGTDDEKIDQFLELKERIEALRREDLFLRPGDLAIDGHEVMEILGLPEGPEVGRILDHLVDSVMDYPELNRKTDLIGLLKQMRDKTS
jgi:poly(A) polymerase/tRNA nucleotidyltransferase (CCA-adding enzyme)